MSEYVQEFAQDEYIARWSDIEYWVQVEAAAELHTMDVLMGKGTPPVARFVRRS